MKNVTIKKMFFLMIEDLEKNEKWGTSHVYTATINAFSLFIGHPDFLLKDLSPSLLKEFESVIRNRGGSWNTVSTYLRTIRAVYNYAVYRGYVLFKPHLFSHVYTGTKVDKKRALPVETLRLIISEVQSYLGGNRILTLKQKTLVQFVFMFLSRGLPFVDLAYLRKKDLVGNMLHYRRKKTGKDICVILTPLAQDLLKLIANDDKRSLYLLPILNSPEGSKEAYHEYQKALRVFNFYLAEISINLGLSSSLSTYTARHSWATMAYYCEIHPGIISEAMGHSSIKVTETYLKPFQDERIDAANCKVLSYIMQGSC